MNAGLDFESKIMVKEDAPRLLREFLNRPGWQSEVIVFSGVTDCYQPIERDYQLTRQCLEVALEARQPVGIITKNRLVVRDLDLLKKLAERNLVGVNLSVTTLDPSLARTLEPRTSTPAARLDAIRQLAEADVPVNVMAAPVIPGLNDSEIPAILEAAREAGATSASSILLRLPLAVEPIFVDWLERERPTEKEKILSRIRACREGELYKAEFGKRMSGTGLIAEQIQQTFKLFRKKFGLDRKLPPLDASQFRPPTQSNGQMHLF